MSSNHSLENLFRENGIHPDSIDLAHEIDQFKQQMTKGLEHHESTSLLMLPTFISSDGELPRDQSAVVIDAGGTNLRMALVSFDSEGVPSVVSFDNQPMPGSLEPVSSEEMFDLIAHRTAGMIEKSSRIGFCFSYVFESTPDRDGRIVALCKEVDVQGIEDKFACAELEKAYRRLGIGGQRIYTMLNDTVATLLGAKAMHGNDGCDGYVGFILGTGMNACYVEPIGQIGKIADVPYSSESMIINLESGLYKGFQQSVIERRVDQKAQIPGDHMFEKMVSGAYFGDVLYEAVCLAADNGLFSDDFLAGFEGQTTINLKEITMYIQNRQPDENFYEKLVRHNPDDRDILDQILSLCYRRAARLLSVMFSSIAEKSGRGLHPDSPLRICAEGTTYYRSPLLLQYLDELRSNEIAGRGHFIEMVKTENATLIGSALAALLNG